MEVRCLDGKGRCLIAGHAASAGTLLLREHALVTSSPCTTLHQWTRLVSMHEQEPFPIDPDWYLAAAAAVVAAKADPQVAAAIGSKFRPAPGAMFGVCGSDLDALRAMDHLGMHDFVSTEDFFATVSIVRFNGFRIPGEQRAIALFDQASLMSHSCCPTAEFDFEDNGCIVVRALKDLNAGDEVCISYLPAFALRQSTEMRRLKLEDHLFICQCSRCTWPADLCRGFCCPDTKCSGVCFMPGSTTCSDDGGPAASLPCSNCGTELAGEVLEAALNYEAQYGFVVEYGTMHQNVCTAQGLVSGASTVFRQHWITIEIAKALAGHYTRQRNDSGEGSAEAAAFQEKVLIGHAAALQPWPWLFNMNKGNGLLI